MSIYKGAMKILVNWVNNFRPPKLKKIPNFDPLFPNPGFGQAIPCENLLFGQENISMKNF